MSLLPAFLLAAWLPSDAQGCSLIRWVADEIGTARRIAEAVVDRVTPPAWKNEAEREGEHLALSVAPDPATPSAYWLASYELQPPQVRDDGTIRISFGGRSLGFRIDRCTGAISELAFRHWR